MPTATLDRVNKKMEALAGEFSSIPYSNQNTVSQLMQVFRLTTDKNSVLSLSNIFDDVQLFINNLPKSANDVDLGKIKQDIDKTISNIGFVRGILGDIEHRMNFQGAKIAVDDVNMNHFIEYLNHINTALSYGSDYLNLVAGVYNSRLEISSGKAKSYTIENIIDRSN